MNDDLHELIIGDIHGKEHRIKCSHYEWGGNGLKLFINSQPVAHFTSYAYWIAE